MTDLKGLSAEKLLALHADVAEELRERGVLRSSNNPTGDLAEHLCCSAFGWKQAGNSNPAIDAIGEDGSLYQVKGRRMTRHNKSRQLGALRALPDDSFDYLVAVLFEHDYSVLRAAIIPHHLVLERSKYTEHTNSWRFMLQDVVWTWPGVRDVTEELRAVAL